MSDQPHEKFQSLANLIFGGNDSFHGAVDVTSRRFLDRTREHWPDRAPHLGAPFEWQSAVNAATRPSSSWEEA